MDVGMWVWPQLTLSPGADVTFDHFVVDNDGISQIDPDHWYSMSAVPDFNPDQHPDRPVSAAGVTILEQGAYRPFAKSTGVNATVWRVRWSTPAGGEEGTTYFRPRLLRAPA